MRENCTILVLGQHETTLLTIFIRVHRPAFGRFFWRKYSELISYDRSVLVTASLVLHCVTGKKFPQFVVNCCTSTTNFVRTTRRKVLWTSGVKMCWCNHGADF